MRRDRRETERERERLRSDRREREIERRGVKERETEWGKREEEREVSSH